MSFLDKLFTEEPVKQPSKHNAQANMPNAPINPAVFTSPATQPAYVKPDTQAPQPVPAAAVNEKNVKLIWDAIIERNLPGPDYLELKTNAASLEQYVPSLEARLAAAFSVLKGQYPNFSKADIIASIDTYINIVNEEKKEGLEECRRVYADTISAKESDLKGVEASLSAAEASIAELQKQLADLNEKKRSLTDEITESNRVLAEKQQLFINSTQAVIDTLNNDKSIISNLNI